MVASIRDRSRWIKCLFYTTLISSLFWGGIAQFDPLGIKTAASIQSESLFMRMVGGPWYQSAAQDKITVVLIDDNYINQIEESWPLSYIMQEMLLSNILSFKPKAVFLDLLYSHNHETLNDSIQQLVDTISQKESSADSAVPIFIPLLIKDVQNVDSCSSARPVAAVPEETSAKRADSDIGIDLEIPVIKEITGSRATKTYVGWAGCGDAYPSFVFQDTEFMTPSFALYDQFCRSKDTPSKVECSAILADEYKSFKKPMMVRWGTGVSKEHKAALEAGGISCAGIDKKEFWSKTGYSAKQFGTAFLQSFSSTADRGRDEPCTYTDTVHATWFLGDISGGTRDYLKDMIENRIVLIGTQVAGVHDNIISPINGQLPGVYLFAMALDNYLTYGANYFTLLSDMDAAVIEICVLFTIAFSMGMLGHLTFIRLSKMDQSTNILQRLGLSILFFLFLKIIIPLCISLLFVLIMWQCRIAPMDWLGVSFLSFFANPIKFADCFVNCKELIKPFAFS